MTTPVIASTFLLTLLLLVGLFFFIRASVKDRTQIATFVVQQSRESILEQLQDYFSQRAYQVIDADPAVGYVTFEGFVRPSWFLAIFLTSLSAIGLLCLILVFYMLLPRPHQALLGLVLAAPVAGIFYWRRAGRPEQVLLKVEPSDSSNEVSKSVITVTAHRDELSELQRRFSLQPGE